MATYASATNPFLRTTSNGIERSCKKEAPGMAVQRIVGDMEPPKFSKLRQCENVHPNEDIATKDLNNNNHELDQFVDMNNNADLITNLMNGHGCDDLLDLTEQTENNPESDWLTESEEITRTCQMLVEETIKREEREQQRKHPIESQVGQEIKPTVVETEQKPQEEYQQQQQQQHRDKIQLLTRGLSHFEINDDDDEDEDDTTSEMSTPMSRDDRRYQHIELIRKLRMQLRDLERYAYERGELDQVPPSILAERQTVILETLKNRLSLNIGTDDIERTDIDELKKQVDKEIHNLIDPLVTKECLLAQLKTQLTDLERYIAHLHETIGKKPTDKRNCLCHLHGCSSRELQDGNGSPSINHRKLSNSTSMSSIDALPRTSRLIRSLVTQLICSDVKEAQSKDNGQVEKSSLESDSKPEVEMEQSQKTNNTNNTNNTSNRQLPVTGVPNFHDGAAWTLHIDKVTLATDSIVNLLTLDSNHQRPSSGGKASFDENLVESIVRRQLVPAIRELLTYGLIDPETIPRPTSYISMLFDPYYLFSSLTCFPSSSTQKPTDGKDPLTEKFHVWHVVEDYYKSKSGPNFKTSSVKTLSQSFNLASATGVSGPIKITSKQALLIAVDDIIETLAKCKPNGPESHFRIFIYTAMNRSKLATWLKLIFRNKSVIRKYYHNFSFVSQPDKMDKFFACLEALSQFKFKLCADVKAIEQFVSAF